MKLHEVKAVVIHWDGGDPKGGDIEGLMSWMQNVRKNGAFYHYFVSGDRIINGRAITERCIHCGNNTYTKEATLYFGPHYCPPWDHRDVPHSSSPNNCTLGVCMLHDHEGGGYSGETLRTSAKLVAMLLDINKLGLDALWTHTDIVGRQTKLCPRAFYKSEYLKDYFFEKVEMNMRERRTI